MNKTEMSFICLHVFGVVNMIWLRTDDSYLEAMPYNVKWHKKKKEKGQKY